MSYTHRQVGILQLRHVSNSTTDHTACYSSDLHSLCHYASHSSTLLAFRLFDDYYRSRFCQVYPVTSLGYGVFCRRRGRRW